MSVSNDRSAIHTCRSGPLPLTVPGIAVAGMASVKLSGFPVEWYTSLLHTVRSEFMTLERKEVKFTDPLGATEKK